MSFDKNNIKLFLLSLNCIDNLSGDTFVISKNISNLLPHLNKFKNFTFGRGAIHYTAITSMGTGDYNTIRIGKTLILAMIKNEVNFNIFNDYKFEYRENGEYIYVLYGEDKYMGGLVNALNLRRINFHFRNNNIYVKRKQKEFYYFKL